MVKGDEKSHGGEGNRRPSRGYAGACAGFIDFGKHGNNA